MNRVAVKEAEQNGQAEKPKEPKIRFEVQEADPLVTLRFPALFREHEKWRDGMRFVLVKRDDYNFELVERDTVVNAETP